MAESCGPLTYGLAKDFPHSTMAFHNQAVYLFKADAPTARRATAHSQGASNVEARSLDRFTGGAEKPGGRRMERPLFLGSLGMALWAFRV